MNVQDRKSKNSVVTEYSSFPVYCEMYKNLRSLKLCYNNLLLGVEQVYSPESLNNHYNILYIILNNHYNIEYIILNNLYQIKMQSCTQFYI